MITLADGADLTLEHIIIDGNREALDESDESDESDEFWDAEIVGNRYGTFCSLTLKDGCVLQNNYTQNMGGAVFGSNMTLTMEPGAVIQNNSTNGAHYGGGIFLANDSVFTMNGGEIKGNAGSRGGGVALICSTMTMRGGTISRNETYSDDSGYGGGIYIADYAAISGLSGSYDIHPGKAAFTMTGGSITQNTAKHYGGGILTFPQGADFPDGTNQEIRISLQGGEISENTVTSGSGGGIAIFFDESYIYVSGGGDQG